MLLDVTMKPLVSYSQSVKQTKATIDRLLIKMNVVMDSNPFIIRNTKPYAEFSSN
jgi:hypothetical protein